MREMDDTISVYLAEMKDENDRLIQELQHVSQPELAPATVQVAEQPEQKQPSLAAAQQEKAASSTATTLENDSRIYIPKNKVASAYSRHQQASANVSPKAPATNNQVQQAPQQLTLEQQVLELAKQGKSSEEIAKQLQKGQTEIELLLKFQH